MISLHERTTAIVAEAATSSSMHSSCSNNHNSSEHSSSMIETSARTLRCSNTRPTMIPLEEWNSRSNHSDSHRMMMRDLSLIVSDPTVSDMDVDDEDDEEIENDDDNSTIISAIREHSRQMDTWFEDEAGNLEVRHHLQGEDEEDGLQEEMLTLQYSQEKLRQEMEVVDLILSPRISGITSFFSPTEDDHRDGGGDTYSDVAGFLEQYEQQRLQIMHHREQENNNKSNDDETRELPPIYACSPALDHEHLLSPYFFSTCTPRDVTLLSTPQHAALLDTENNPEEENNNDTDSKEVVVGELPSSSFDLWTPYSFHRQTREAVEDAIQVDKDDTHVSNSRDEEDESFDLLSSPYSPVKTAGNFVSSSSSRLHVAYEKPGNDEDGKSKPDISIETALSPVHQSTTSTSNPFFTNWIATSTPRTDLSSDSILWRTSEEEFEESLLAASWMATALLASAWIKKGEDAATNTGNTTTGITALESPQREGPPTTEASTLSPRYPITNPFLAAAVWLSSPGHTEEASAVVVESSKPKPKVVVVEEEPQQEQQQQQCPIETHETEEEENCAPRNSNLQISTFVSQKRPSSTKTRRSSALNIETIEVYPMTPLLFDGAVMTPVEVEVDSPVLGQSRFFGCCQQRSDPICGETSEGGTGTGPATNPFCMMGSRAGGDEEMEQQAHDHRRNETAIADDLTEAPSNDSNECERFDISIASKEEEEQLAGFELVLHDTTTAALSTEDEGEESIDTDIDEIQASRDDEESTASPRRNLLIQPDPIFEIRQVLSDGDAARRARMIRESCSSSTTSSSSTTTTTTTTSNVDDSIEDCGRRRMNRRLGGPEEMAQLKKIMRSPKKERDDNIIVQKSNSADSSESSETKELLKCNEQLLAAVVNFDYASYRALVSDDLVGIQGGEMLVGARPNFQQHHKHNRTMIPTKISLENPVVRFLSSTSALVTYTRVDELEDGSTSERLEWNETRVWEKREGEGAVDKEYYPWVNCHFHQSKSNP